MVRVHWLLVSVSYLSGRLLVGSHKKLVLVRAERPRLKRELQSGRAAAGESGTAPPRGRETLSLTDTVENKEGQ